MTPSQLLIFKTAILADVSQAGNRTTGDHGAMAVYYNGADVGAIWRPNIGAAELNTAIVWSEFAALTSLLQNTYMSMIVTGSVDTTSANVRAGFATVFGAGSQSRTNLLALAQRAPTRFEQLFTTAQVCTLYGATATVVHIVAALGS